MFFGIPSGKRLQKTMERSTMLLIWKLTFYISNSYVSLPEGRWSDFLPIGSYWDIYIYSQKYLMIKVG